MSQRELPTHPNLEHLKNQARTLLEQQQAGDGNATSRFAAYGITIPKLADALHVIAREYGFDTWPALKLHVALALEDPAQALVAAIRADDAALVKQVLARHPSLPSRLNEPLPGLDFDAQALITAVQKNNLEMVDALLNAGADTNARTHWWAGGFGVLDFAEPAMAEHLIARGAIVDIHAAARLGKIDRVRDLLAADPQLVHARGGDGQLPLHFAATVEIAELLLHAGADIDARDIDHESTAAQYMVCMRQMLEWREPFRHDVARYLVARGAQTDIIMAAALGDVALAEQILNNDPETIRTTISDRYFPRRDPRSGGCIYNFGFGSMMTPHGIAHNSGHTAVFDLLMQRSAPWLRLTQAAEIGDEAMVQSILIQHPRIFQKLTPNAARRIIGATLRNNTRAVQLLIEAGWPVDAQNDEHQTPLHYAAWHGNIDIVRTLLAHKASPNIFETEHGGNPLAWALHGSLYSWHRNSGDYPAVVKALLEAGTSIPAPENMPLQGAPELLAVIDQWRNDSRS